MPPSPDFTPPAENTAPAPEDLSPIPPPEDDQQQQQQAEDQGTSEAQGQQRQPAGYGRVALPPRAPAGADETTALIANTARFQARQDNLDARSSQQEEAQAVKAQSIAARQQQIARNNAILQQGYATGRETYLDENHDVHFRLPDEVYQAKQANKNDTNEQATQYQLQNRPYVTSKAADGTVKVIPKDSEADWQQQVADQKATAIETARQATLKGQQAALQAQIADDAANGRAPLADKERAKYEKSLVQDSQAARTALITHLGKQAQVTAGGFMGFGASPTPEAQAAQAAMARLQPPNSYTLDSKAAADLQPEDMDLLKQVNPDLHGKLSTTRDVLATDDQNLARQNQNQKALADLELRSKNLPDWVAKHRADIINAPDPQAHAQALADDLDEGVSYHAQQLSQLQAEKQAHLDKLTQIQADNATALAKGFSGNDVMHGKVVDVPGTDAQGHPITQTWDANLYNQFKQAKAEADQFDADTATIRGPQLQAQQQLLQEKAQITQEAHDHAANVAQQQRADSLAKLATSGQPRVAQALSQTDAEISQRQADLLAKYPQGPQTNAEAAHAFQTLQDDATAKYQALAEKGQQVAAAGSTLYNHLKQLNPTVDWSQAGSNAAMRNMVTHVAKQQGLDLTPEEITAALASHRAADWSVPYPGQATADWKGVPVLDQFAHSIWGRTSNAPTEPFRRLPDGSVTVNPALAMDKTAWQKAVVEADKQQPLTQANKDALEQQRRSIQSQAALAALPLLSDTTDYQDFIQNKTKSDPTFAHLTPAQQVATYVDEKPEKSLPARVLATIGGSIYTGLVGYGNMFTGLAAAATGNDWLNERAQAAESMRQQWQQKMALTGYTDTAALRGLSQLTDMGVQLAPAMLGGALGQIGGRMVAAARGAETGEAFLKAMSTGALAGSSTALGAQTTSQVYVDAFRHFQEQGLDDATAHQRALVPAISAGLGAAVLSGLQGLHGVQSVFKGEVGKNLVDALKPDSIKALAQLKTGGLQALAQPAVRNAVADLTWQMTKHVATEAGSETVKMGAFSLMQSLIEKATYRPDLKPGEILAEAFQSGLMGGAMGSVMSGAHSAAGVHESLADAQPSTLNPPLAAPHQRPETIAAAQHAIANYSPEGQSPEQVQASRLRASTALKIAQGGFDSLSPEELASVGYERTGKDKAPMPLKDYQGPQILDFADRERTQPIIKQGYIDALDQHLPAVHAALGMDEIDAREHYATLQASASTPSLSSEQTGPEAQATAPAPDSGEPRGGPPQGGAAPAAASGADTTQEGGGARSATPPSAGSDYSSLRDLVRDKKLSMVDAARQIITREQPADAAAAGALIREHLNPRMPEQAAHNLAETIMTPTTPAEAGKKSKANGTTALAGASAERARVLGNALEDTGTHSKEQAQALAAKYVAEKGITHLNHGQQFIEDFKPWLEKQTQDGKTRGTGPEARAADPFDASAPAPLPSGFRDVVNPEAVAKEDQAASEKVKKAQAADIKTKLEEAARAAEPPKPTGIKRAPKLEPVPGYYEAQDRVVRATPLGDRKRARTTFRALDQGLHAYGKAFSKVVMVTGKHNAILRAASMGVHGDTLLINPEQLVHQMRGLARSSDAVHATVTEELIHRTAEALAAKDPAFSRGNLVRLWQRLPGEAQKLVWQAYHNATIESPEAAPVALTETEQYHMSHEFLRMLVQDKAFRGQITETVDNPGVLRWIANLLKTLGGKLREFLGTAPKDVQSDVAQYEAKITAALEHFKGAFEASKPDADASRLRSESLKQLHLSAEDSAQAIENAHIEAQRNTSPQARLALIQRLSAEEQAFPQQEPHTEAPADPFKSAADSYQAMVEAREQHFQANSSPAAKEGLHDRLAAMEQVFPAEGDEPASPGEGIKSAAESAAAMLELHQQAELAAQENTSPQAKQGLARRLASEAHTTQQMYKAAGKELAEAVRGGKVTATQAELAGVMARIATGDLEKRDPGFWKVAGTTLRRQLAQLGIGIKDGSLFTRPGYHAAYVERRHIILRQEALDRLGQSLPITRHLIGMSEAEARQHFKLPETPAPQTRPEVTDEAPRPVEKPVSPAAAEPALISHPSSSPATNPLDSQLASLREKIPTATESKLDAALTKLRKSSAKPGEPTEEPARLAHWAAETLKMTPEGAKAMVKDYLDLRGLRTEAEAREYVKNNPAPVFEDSPPPDLEVPDPMPVAQGAAPDEPDVEDELASAADAHLNQPVARKPKVKAPAISPEISAATPEKTPEPDVSPAVGLISPEESARHDQLTSENKDRLTKLTGNQFSQLAEALGARHAGATQEALLNNTHPDDLKAALDEVTKVETSTPSNSPAKGLTDTPATAEAKVEEQVQKVATIESPRDAKQIKQEILQNLAQAVRGRDPGKPKRVTFKIPGDGTFTVWDTAENLTALMRRVKALDAQPYSAKDGPETAKVNAAKVPKNWALDWGTQEAADQAVSDYVTIAGHAKAAEHPDQAIPKTFTAREVPKPENRWALQRNPEFSASIAEAVAAMRAATGNRELPEQIRRGTYEAESPNPTWNQLREWAAQRAHQATQSANIDWEPHLEPSKAETSAPGAPPAPPPVAEPPIAAKKSKPVVRTKTPVAKIEDFGEKIGGARKDRWKERGLSLDDYGTLSDTERQAYTNKLQVFPKPDYAQAIEDGTPKNVAYALKNVHDAISPKPNLSTAEQADPALRDTALRRYVEVVGRLRDGLKTVRTPEQLKALRDELFPSTSRGLYSYDFTPQAKTDLRLASAGKYQRALAEAMQIDKYDLRRIDDKLTKLPNWPEPQEQWQRMFQVREKSPSGWEVTKKEGYYTRILSAGHPTKEAAEAWAKNAATKARKEEPKRPLNPDASRTGPDYRQGRNITGDDLLQTFGFRGGEFGNWTNEADRQQSLNQAFDAMHDLARILNVPPQALSLNGELGLAFGARGSGRAAAHYEPSRVVINLTRTYGAGALAHEWAHALDDYLGRQATAGQVGKYVSDSGVKGNEGYRAQLAATVNAVMQAIHERQWTPAEHVADLQARNTEAKTKLASWLKSVDRATAHLTLDETTQGYIQAMRDQLLGNTMPLPTTAGRPNMAEVAGDMLREYAIARNAQKAKIDWPVTGGGKMEDLAHGLGRWSGLIHATNADLARAEAGTLETPARQIPTDLLKASKEQGNYWQRRHELFARSFEAYVEDRIRKEGNASPYLVQSTFDSGDWGNLYPQGDERTATNAAFQHMVNTLEHKATDRGTALYAAQRRPEMIRRLDESADEANIQSHDDAALRDPAHFLRHIGHWPQADQSGSPRASAAHARRHAGRGEPGLSRVVEGARNVRQELDPAPFRDPAKLIATRGEHVVLRDETTGRVVKMTRPGFVGMQGTDAPAYLERFAWGNKYLGDDVKFEGITTFPGETEPRFVISQPFIEGRAGDPQATPDEIRDFFRTKGFVEHKGQFIHPDTELQAWDTQTPGNLIVRPDGSVYPIDVQLALADPADVAAVRAQSGRHPDTLFASERNSSGGSQSPDDDAHAAATSPHNDLPEPTAAQKKAGNYQMGHTRIGGLDLSIENPAGSVRRGMGPDGKPWETPMHSHYGYLTGSEGRDGDHIDVFVKPGTPADYKGPVWAVNQRNHDGSFDEHKMVLGASGPVEALAEYLQNYEPGWRGAMSLGRFADPAAFKTWATEAKRLAPARGHLEKPLEVTPGMQKAAQDLVKARAASGTSNPVLAASARSPEEAEARRASSRPGDEDPASQPLHAKVYSTHGQPDPYTGHPSLITGPSIPPGHASAIYDNLAQDLAASRETRPGGTGLAATDRPANSPGRGTVPVVELAKFGFTGTDPQQPPATGPLRYLGGQAEGSVYADPGQGVVYKFLHDFEGGPSRGAFPMLTPTDEGRLGYSLIPAPSDRHLQVRVAVQNGLGGTPTEIVGRTPQGHWILKQPLSADPELRGSSQTVNQAIDRMGLVQIPHGMIENAGPAHVAWFRDRPWFVTDTSADNFIGDTQDHPRAADLLLSPLPPEVLSRVRDLDRVVAQAQDKALELGHRDARLFAGDRKTLDAETGEEVRSAPGAWAHNNIDKAVTSQIGRLFGAVKETAPAKALADMVGNSKAGQFFEHAIEGLKARLVPMQSMPSEALALFNEMKVNRNLGRAHALDIFKSLVHGHGDFTDYAFPEGFKDNLQERKMVFLALDSKIDGHIPIEQLPAHLQDVAKTLRKALIAPAVEAVRLGRMSMETFHEMMDSMGHYLADDPADKNVFSRAAKMLFKVNPMKAQRSTGFHIVDTETPDPITREKGMKGALVPWDDKGKQWRFNSQEHRDAFYRQFVRDHVWNNEVKGRQDQGLRGLKRESLDHPETLTDYQRGFLKGKLEQARNRFRKGDPLTLEQHEKSGLIMDPIVSAMRRIAATNHDNAVYALFKGVAEHPGWTSDSPALGFTQIPDSRSYGPLAGKHVLDSIARQVQEVNPEEDPAWALMDDLVRTWAKGKTTLNLGTHIRNFLRNIAFARLAGVNPLNPANLRYVIDAAKMLRGQNLGDNHLYGSSLERRGAMTNRELLLEMAQQGVTGSDYSATELRGAQDELLGLLPDPTALETAGDSVKAVSTISRILEAGTTRLGSRLRQGDRIAQRLYEANNEYFKIMAYLKNKALGMAPEQAAAETKKWFHFYGLIGRSGTLKGIRRIVPFFSAFREDARILKNAVKERPLNLAASVLVPMGLTKLAFNMLGLRNNKDQDEVLKDMRGHLRGTADDTLPGFSVLLPSRTDGNLQQWDLTNATGFSHFLSHGLDITHQDFIPSLMRELMTSSPFANIAASIAFNQDAFSGRPVVQPDMTETDKLKAYAGAAAQELLPSMAPVPGSSSWNTIASSMDRGTGRDLAKRSVGQAVLRALLGIDVRNANPDLNRYISEQRAALHLPENVFTGGTTAQQTVKRMLFSELVQANDGPANLPRIKGLLNKLEELGGGRVLTSQDLEHMLAGHNPLNRIADKAHQQMILATAPPIIQHGFRQAQEQYQKILAQAPAIIGQAQAYTN